MQPSMRKARYGSGTICKHITGTGVRDRARVSLGLLLDGRQNRPSRTFTALRDAQVWIRKMNAEADAELFSLGAVDHSRLRRSGGFRVNGVKKRSSDQKECE